MYYVKIVESESVKNNNAQRNIYGISDKNYMQTQHRWLDR